MRRDSGQRAWMYSARDGLWHWPGSGRPSGQTRPGSSGTAGLGWRGQSGVAEGSGEGAAAWAGARWAGRRRQRGGALLSLGSGGLVIGLGGRFGVECTNSSRWWAPSGPTTVSTGCGLRQRRRGVLT